MASLFTPAGTNYVSVLDLAAAAAWYVEKFGLRQRPTNPGDREVLNKLLLGKFVTVQKQYIARIRAGIHNLNVARSRTARLEPTSKD